MSEATTQAARARSVTMLRTAMGPAIAAALDDPQVVEVMLNPDGRLWFDRLGSGRVDSGITLSVADAERILRLVAASVSLEITRDKPLLSAELPGRSEEHTSELPSLMRISYAVFCLKKKKQINTQHSHTKYEHGESRTHTRT